MCKDEEGSNGAAEQHNQLMNSKDCCCSVVFYMLLLPSHHPSPLFIIHAPLIVETPNYTFIIAPHSCVGCSKVTTNLHEGLLHSDRIEWVHCG